MGEKERGKPDLAQEPQLPFTVPLQASASASSTSIPSMPNHTTSFTSQSLTPVPSSSRQMVAPINSSVIRPNSNVKPEDPARPAAPLGWRTAWRYFIYEKWRLCAFIALAVMVSRFSTRGWALSEGRVYFMPFSFIFASHLLFPPFPPYCVHSLFKMCCSPVDPTSATPHDHQTLVAFSSIGLTIIGLGHVGSQH